MDILENIERLIGTNLIGGIIIGAMLAACLVGCSVLLYDTVLDTRNTLRDLLKNKKIKK